MNKEELEKELNYAKTHCLFHSDCPTQKENAELKKQISDMSNVINDLVHLGTFDENTDEEYLNYEIHEALKKAEKYLPK